VSCATAKAAATIQNTNAHSHRLWAVINIE
jgi:hypothetical protein